MLALIDQATRQGLGIVPREKSSKRRRARASQRFVCPPGRVELISQRQWGGVHCEQNPSASYADWRGKAVHRTQTPGQSGYAQSLNNTLRDKLLTHEHLETQLNAKVLIEHCWRRFNSASRSRALSLWPPALTATLPASLAPDSS